MKTLRLNTAIVGLSLLLVGFASAPSRAVTRPSFGRGYHRPNACRAVLPYRKYGGKYPFDIRKSDGSIDRKLKRLLGRSYPLYQQNSAVEVPCIVRDGFLVLQGCRAHMCDTDRSFALINVTTGTAYVGIISNDGLPNKKTRTFHESSNPLPALFRRLLTGGQIS